MNVCCEYCLEMFDLDNVPVRLPCAHVLCKSCVGYLKNLKLISFCPIDHKAIDFAQGRTCENTLKSLDSYCSVHCNKAYGICKKHYCKVCPQCKAGHENCEIMVDSNLSQGLNKMTQNCAHISMENAQSMQKVKGFVNKFVWIQENANENLRDIEKFNKALVSSQTLFQKINLITQSKTLFLSSPHQVKHSTESLRNLLQNPSIPHLPAPDAISPKVLLDNMDPLVKSLINEKRDLVNTELSIIKKTHEYLFFFNICDKSNAGKQIYSAIINNISTTDYIVNGIGIGIPSVPNEILSIDTIAISTNPDNIIYTDHDLIVCHNAERICGEIEFSRNIMFKSNASLIIYLEMQGILNYVFCSPLQNDTIIQVNDFDGNEFQEVFPILYFTLHQWKIA